MGNEVVSVAFFTAGFAPDHLRSLRVWRRPGIAGQHPLDRLLDPDNERLVITSGHVRRCQGQIEPVHWSPIQHRHWFALLFQIPDPKQSDRIVCQALRQADCRAQTIALPHDEADQDQLNARKDSESKRDTEYLLPPAIPENTTKKHEQKKEPALHEAHAAFKSQDCSRYPIRASIVPADGARNSG